jgi:hypothetical protein
MGWSEEEEEVSSGGGDRGGRLRYLKQRELLVHSGDASSIFLTRIYRHLLILFCCKHEAADRACIPSTSYNTKRAGQPHRQNAHNHLLAHSPSRTFLSASALSSAPLVDEIVTETTSPNLEKKFRYSSGSLQSALGLCTITE